MGRIKQHIPVKLVIGLLYIGDAAAARARRAIARRFGVHDAESLVFDFGHTSYYEREFGPGLRRQFVSVRRLVRPESLPDIKHFTNRLEARLARDGRRTVNIDPGYLTLAKVVLATTKDFAHRLYLGKRIFGEVTLSYVDKTYRPLEWTYPDYRSREYISFFNRVRSLYAEQSKPFLRP